MSNKAQQIIQQLDIIKNRSVSVTEGNRHVRSKDVQALEYAQKAIRKAENTRISYWQGAVMGAALTLFWVYLILNFF
jgi:hypothetical protein